MNLILIDDEVHILDMLKSLIDWEDLSLTLVGTATNGISAYEMLMALRPDIAITDIRIPGYDGLQLIQRCREQGLDTQFIIISGFKQFEYAQNAIRYGVKDYLLKPIKKSELNTILKQLIRTIQGNREHAQILKKQNILLKFSQIRLKDNFLKTLMEAPDSVGENIEKINQDYLLNLQPSAFCFFICKIDIKQAGEGEGSEDYFLRSLKEKIIVRLTDAVAVHCQNMLYKEAETRIVFFLNYSPEKEPLWNECLRASSNGIFDYVKKFEDVGITIAKGIPVENISLCGKSLRSAEATLKQRILLGVNRILYPTQHIQPRQTKDIFGVTEQRSMKKNIESFDMDALRQQVEEIFTSAELLETGDASFYWDLCRDISGFFWNTLLNMHITNEIDQGEKEADLYRMLDGCSNLRQLRHRFIGYLPQQFKLYYDTEHPPENVTVMIAKKYIANHYREKISLRDIAEQVYLNPVYFSICFKKDTGLTFIDYVNEYRIEKSKDILKSGPESIQIVAENVGFANARYFSKTFKRYVGLTPAEYRKKYSQYGREN